MAHETTYKVTVLNPLNLAEEWLVKADDILVVIALLQTRYQDDDMTMGDTIDIRPYNPHEHDGRPVWFDEHVAALET